MSAAPEIAAVGVARTFDADHVNALANHLAVRPFVGRPDAGPLDLRSVLADRRNYALAWETGCFLFEPCDLARYELHTMIAPEGRGAGVLPAAAEAFRWMFVNTDCAELVTKVPAANKPAGLMARRAGFQSMFTRPTAWEDGTPVDYFVLTLDHWRSLDDTLAAEGHAFHEALEAAKKASGSALVVHEDDDAHDRAAGLACLMAMAGNPGKAVWAYNRWARLAGYQTIEIAPQPVVYDIRDALVTFQDSKMEVLQCR